VNAIWQLASAAHDDAIVAMFMALNAEDPGPAPAEPQQMRVTLDRLRIEPYRGRAAVCEMNGRVVSYSLLIAFWSNELGGEICTIDELYVSPEYRSRGLATALFTELLDRDSRLWNASPAALALEVSPTQCTGASAIRAAGLRGAERRYAPASYRTGYQPMNRLKTKAAISARPNSNCNCPERAIARLCASAPASPATSRI